MKTCSKCGESKPLDEFLIDRRRHQPRSECRQCKTKQVEDRRYLRDYGITRDEYFAILRAQDYCCAICGRKNPSERRLSLDHNHETRRHRGALCIRCNRGLGWFQDNIELFRNVVHYLERYD